MSVAARWLIKKIFLSNPAGTVLDEKNRERNSRSCSGQTCSRFWLSFSPDSLSICWLSLAASGKFISQKLMTNQLLSGFCVVQQDTFYHHQDYKQVKFYKKTRLQIIGPPIDLRRENHNSVTIGSTLEPFKQKLTKLIFSSRLLATLRCYAKRHWNFE